MAEYIEREAAIASAFAANAIGNSAYRDVYDVVNRLRLVPAADVRPVVLCRDCKHSYEDISGRCCAYGVCVDWLVDDDFFCAYGVQKFSRPEPSEEERAQIARRCGRENVD